MSPSTSDDAPTTFFRRGQHAGHTLPRPAPAVRHIPVRDWLGPTALVCAGLLCIKVSTWRLLGLGGDALASYRSVYELYRASAGIGVGGYLVATHAARFFQAFSAHSSASPLWRRVGRNPELLGLALGALVLLGGFVPTIGGLLVMRGEMEMPPEAQAELQRLIPDVRTWVIASGTGLLGAIVGFCRLEVLRLRA